MPSAKAQGARLKKGQESNLQVILVGGIGGGLLALPIIGLYMLCLKPIIRRLLPGSRVFVFQPAIFQSIHKTADRLADMARDAFYFHGQQTIIIGHSRGSLEAIQSVLSNPDLLDFKMLKGLILMNPPFKGSPLADLLRDILSWLPRWKALEEICSSTLEPQWETRWSFSDPRLQIQLQKLTVLVRGSLPPTGKVCWPLIYPFKRLNSQGIKSDGLVPIESQTLPWVPSLVMNREIHHGYDTCISTLSSGSTRQKMELYARCFDHLLEQPEIEEPQKKLAPVRSLKVATYNVGGLKIPIWGIPFPRTRWQAITEVLADRDLDIIFFQELFGRKLRSDLPKKFPDYEIFLGPSDPKNGLAVLVRKSLLSNSGRMEFSYNTFSAQRRLETLFGFEKGFISCLLKLDDAVYPIVLINIHLTAFNAAKILRRSQRRQILQHIRQFQMADKNSHVIIGGDFNEPLRMPWALQEPSFSDQTVIHQLKNKLNRKEKSQNIDYILAHSWFHDEMIETSDFALDMKEEKITVKTKAGPMDLELSDHWMVRSTVKIMRVLE